MKDVNLNNSFLCKHLKHRNRSVDCPAEYSIYFVNTVLQKLAMKDYTYIVSEKTGFGPTLQQELRIAYPDSEVYWALGREKVRTKDLIVQAEQYNHQDNENTSHEFKTFQAWMKRLLILLNSHFHSGTFLHNLFTHTQKADAEFFTVTVDKTGIKLSSYYDDNFIKSRRFPQNSEYIFSFTPSDVDSPKQYFQSCRDKWENNFKDIPFEAAFQEVRSYCAGWESYAVEDGCFSPSIWRKETKTGEEVTDELRRTCMDESRRAVQHLALISLYMCNKGLSFENDECQLSATYFLSPTIRGKYDSSMVVYWGPKGLPERPFLYLLSMLLGLNQAPILNARSKHELKQVAFRNSGHVLKNRCNSISGYLQEIGIDSVDDAKKGKFRSAQHLSDKLVDLFDTLWLWSYDNFAMLVEDLKGDPAKKARYLAVDNCNICSIIDSLVEVTAETRIFDGLQQLLSLHIEIPLEFKCTLKPELSTRPGEQYRLSDMVLEVILYEIMLNAIRHGYINKKDQSDVTLNVTKCVVCNDEALLFWNGVNTEIQESKDKYNELPEEWELIHQDKMKGLGIAAQLLENLKVGKIWHRRSRLKDGDCYLVALHLVGLSIERL